MRHLGHTINAASFSGHHLNVADDHKTKHRELIKLSEFCQVALTQSERSNIPSGKGDSQMHVRIHSICFLHIILFCDSIYDVFMFLLFPFQVQVGWFAMVCQCLPSGMYPRPE